jgi:hypothetical protein
MRNIGSNSSRLRTVAEILYPFAVPSMRWYLSYRIDEPANAINQCNNFWSLQTSTAENYVYCGAPHPLSSLPPPILSRASSMTTEFPRMTCSNIRFYLSKTYEIELTTIPNLTFSPPSFSSTASSSTMFKKTYTRISTPL